MLELDLGVTNSVLDALSMRSKVAMHNLANQGTPGFKAYRVEFEDELRGVAAKNGDQGAVKPRVVRDESGVPGQNNVSVIDELGLLAKVSMLNDVFTKRAAGYFNNLNKAIRGR